MVMDALMAGGKGPKLLWSHDFAGSISYAAISKPGDSDTFYIASLTGGTDGRGYTATSVKDAVNSSSGTSQRSEIIIANGDVVAEDATDTAAVYSISQATNDMPGGYGNKVILTQLKRTPAAWNSETPQLWKNITYRWNKTNQLPGRCYKFSMRTPSNLSAVLTHSSPTTSPAWLEAFFLKDEDTNSAMYYRLGFVLVKEPNESGMRFRLRFDLFRRDLNNNVISVDTPTALWYLLSDEGSLEEGKCYDVYIYFEPRPSKTDLTGITKVVVINTTDNIVSMADSITGVPTTGYTQTQVGRIAWCGCYTGSATAFSIEYSGCQIWDSMPLHISRYTYNRAKFYAPLRGSLALTNGTGSATFTRATACWDFNHIGKLMYIPSGAVRMRGYRPVVNRVNSSEGAFALVVRASSSTGNTDVPSGKNCTTSTKLIEDTTVTATHYGTRTITAPVLGTYKIRQYIKPAGRTSVNIYGSGSFPFPSGSSAAVDLSTGAVTGTASAHITATLLADGWVEVISTHVPTATGSHSLYTELRSGGTSTYTGDGVSGVLSTGVMAVNITPNALTTVPEYVSVGVLSSPWHGAGADGVKYYNTYEDGTDIADADYRGVGLNPNQIINTLLWCRDLTNAAWIKTNVTTALTQTGIDGQANACTLLTATAADGTALQTITDAAAAACSGFYVKRSVGSGSVYFTRDGGANWTDITSSINSTDFILVKIENTSVLNPQVGFKIATSGDAIIVDAGINHLGTKIASCPILTTSASVTVNAETLTYPTTSNIDNLQGSILATFTADSYSSGMGNIVGSSTAGLATSSSYTCQAKDGTNTVNGSAASPSGTIKIGMAWESTFNVMHAIGENGVEASGTYDDSLGLSTIAILPSVDGYVKDVACFTRVLSSEEVQSVFNS